MDERLKREGIKSHKQRVEEYNKYLSNLSEHHDMYVSLALLLLEVGRASLTLRLIGPVSDLANTCGGDAARELSVVHCICIYIYAYRCSCMPVLKALYLLVLPPSWWNTPINTQLTGDTPI